ncbi:MAG: hypothetical protein N2508_14700 [Anaerolineae bacterium]|nr:hypothetical protein [Anaerolineae bacterium]
MSGKTRAIVGTALIGVIAIIMVVIFAQVSKRAATPATPVLMTADVGSL